MSTYGWSTFVGSTVQGRYVIETLARAESRMAIFTASATVEQYSGEVLLTAVRGSQDECNQYLRRFLEAKFLKHPNLMDVLDAGEADIQGTHIAFIVTEPAGSSLQQEETLDQEAAWRLSRDLAAGLGYLHSENLVYCALRPETTWRVGRTWKLGDYHELRLAGMGRTAETRAMMGRTPEVPPEAFEGVVGPAWDVWALGVTLARVLRRDSRERRAGPLPAQFEAIVNRCLDPDPAARITMPEVTELLADRPSWPAQDSAAVAVTTADEGMSAPLSPPTTTEPVTRARRTKLPFLAAMAGVAATLRRKTQSLFSPSQKSPRTQTLFNPRASMPRMEEATPSISHREKSARTREVGRRSNSKWMLFPIAGAIVGATLTLFALKHDPQKASGATDRNSVATGGRAPASTATGPARPEAEVTKPSPDTSSADRSADRVKDSPIENRIEVLLNRWVQSTRNRDVDQQLACYTPVVDAFYGRRQLSAAELRAEKLRQFAAIRSILKFQISNVRISPRGPSNAVVSFKKDWDFGTFAGSEQDELALRLVDGEWRIASERGKKLYWVRRDKREPQKTAAQTVDVAER